MAIKSVLLLAGLAVLATAQSSTSSVVASSTQSQAMPAVATQGFNPNNVTTNDKYNWCLSQRHTCVDICGSTEANECDNVALTYNCVCSNGTAPDVTRYVGSLPYLICLANYGQCINAHPNDAEGQGVCQQNEAFCTDDTTNLVSAASSTMGGTATSTGSMTMTTGSSGGSGSGSGSATSSAAHSSSSGSATTNTVASGAFAAMIFAVFDMLL